MTRPNFRSSACHATFGAKVGEHLCVWTGGGGQQKQSNDPSDNQHNLNTPTTGRH